MNNTYPYSVFYFTKSVYEGAAMKKKPAFSLVLKSILMNIRYKEKIGTHITFTSKQILELVKSVDYAEKFKGFMQLGKNIAFPEELIDIYGDRNFKLVQLAINKNGDILGQVKIVVDDYETKQAITRIVEDADYPLLIIESQEALEEMVEIEKKLLETLG